MSPLLPGFGSHPTPQRRYRSSHTDRQNISMPGTGTALSSTDEEQTLLWDGPEQPLPALQFRLWENYAFGSGNLHFAQTYES